MTHLRKSPSNSPAIGGVKLPKESLSYPLRVKLLLQY